MSATVGAGIAHRRTRSSAAVVSAFKAPRTRSRASHTARHTRSSAAVDADETALSRYDLFIDPMKGTYYTNKQLQRMCREEGLSTKGNKTALMDRLDEASSSHVELREQLPSLDLLKGMHGRWGEDAVVPWGPGCADWWSMCLRLFTDNVDSKNVGPFRGDTNDLKVLREIGLLPEGDRGQQLHLMVSMRTSVWSDKERP